MGNALLTFGLGLVVLFIVSLMVPVPWLLLAAWLEERTKTQRLLAKARLIEAEAALMTAKRSPAFREEG